MMQLPERVDIDEAEKACDFLAKMMRVQSMNDEAQNAVAIVCRYVQRTKATQRWLEVVIEAQRNCELSHKKEEMDGIGSGP